MRTQLMGALLAIPALTCGTRAELSHDAQHMHHHAPPPAACQTTALACASVATPAFAPDGKLWLTWVAGGRVSVASSTDHGKTFSQPTTLAATALSLDDGPDARPKIVAGSGGRLVLTYATRDQKYNGHAFIVRSTDDGKTFSAPQAKTRPSGSSATASKRWRSIPTAASS